jgi:hypothetical protein
MLEAGAFSFRSPLLALVTIPGFPASSSTEKIPTFNIKLMWKPSNGSVKQHSELNQKHTSRPDRGSAL